MELRLRYRDAAALRFDESIDVGSQDEWRAAVAERKPISSVLRPAAPLFRPRPEPGPFWTRRHGHERGYRNDPSRNASYREAAEEAASRLDALIAGTKVLVYAPLRGALPIWRAVGGRLRRFEGDVHFPVTSSFVFYPPEWKIRNRKGRPASGRTTHILEMKRLRPMLRGYGLLVYVDEIVSGSVMAGYLDEMLELGIDREIKIAAVGLADARGARSEMKRKKIESMKSAGRLADFIWAGCDSLVSEDQKFLLGLHYADYGSGLNAVPVLDEALAGYPEKADFDREVMPGTALKEDSWL